MKPPQEVEVPIPAYRPMISRIAFGTFIGILISMAIDPILELLPNNDLIRRFAETLMDDVIQGVFPILMGILAARIKRLDQFIAVHGKRLSLVIAAVFTLLLWVHARTPLSFGVACALGFTFVAALIFMRVCLYMAQISMWRPTEEQLKEYQRRREEDAQRLQYEALAGMRDIEETNLLIAGRAAADLAAASNQMIFGGFFGIVAILFLGIAGTVNGFFLYGLEKWWPLLVGFITSSAAFAFVGIVDSISSSEGNRIPIDEKWTGFGVE